MRTPRREAEPLVVNASGRKALGLAKRVCGFALDLRSPAWPSCLAVLRHAIIAPSTRIQYTSTPFPFPSLPAFRIAMCQEATVCLRAASSPSNDATPQRLDVVTVALFRQVQGASLGASTGGDTAQ
eukprot:363572-Chlamydomonas_euryale.AAC.10